MMLVLCLLVVAAQAQKKGKSNGNATPKYKVTEKGVPCAIHSTEKKAKLKNGDIAVLQLRYATEKDSVLFDSWKMGGPIQIKLQAAQFKGDMMDALSGLAPGDSASFLIPADSLFEKTFMTPRPDYIKAGSAMRFTTKIVSVTSEQEIQAKEQAESKDKIMEEKLALEKYIADNKLVVQTTASGLMYVITNPGTGKQAEAKQTVKVHYTGKLLNGTKFDSSLDRNEPLEFQLGVGMVIKGWDEGIALLKEGGKALLIIPSNLAYGARGAGNVIPPFSPLTFEVELVSVQ